MLEGIDRKNLKGKAMVVPFGGSAKAARCTRLVGPRLRMPVVEGVGEKSGAATSALAMIESSGIGSCAWSKNGTISACAKGRSIRTGIASDAVDPELTRDN